MSKGKRYVLHIAGSGQSGYYASGSHYQPVPRDRATILRRTEVDRIRAALRKLGYSVYREEA